MAPVLPRSLRGARPQDGAEIAAKIETEELEARVLAPVYERDPELDRALRGEIPVSLQNYARQMLTDEERQLIAEGREQYLYDLDRRKRRLRSVVKAVKCVLVLVLAVWFIVNLPGESCDEACASYYSTHYEQIGAEH